MTGQEAKELAELYLGAEIPEALVIINEALNIIGDMALNHDDVTIPAGSIGSWVSLPSDTTAVIKVVDSNERPSSSWELRGLKLRLNEGEGDHSVVIRRLVTPLQNLSQDIDIHPAFYSSIVFYLRAFSKLADDDTSTDGKEHLALFQSEVQKAHMTLMQIRKTL